MEERDIPAIKAIHESAGYDYPFPTLDSLSVEAADVVVGDDDVPIMGAMAKRVAEVVLFCAPGGVLHPLVKMEAIKMLHHSIRDKIVPLGFYEANAFLPPQIERSHGRHLMKMFGWVKNWPSFTLRDWKVPNG
jgi:hypothetical protein